MPVKKAGSSWTGPGTAQGWGGFFFDVDIHGLADASGWATMAYLGIKDAVHRNAFDVGRLTVRLMSEEAPKGRTGELKRSFRFRVRGFETGFNLKVETDKPYVDWVINGRGVVLPVRAKVLHWITKDGKEVFAKRAGPSEPNNFPERAWQRAEPMIRRKWGQAIRGVVNQ